MREEETYKVVTSMFLITFNLLVALPVTIMVVWNVLFTGLTGFDSIGYGEAWAILIIRALLHPGKGKTNDEGVTKDIENSLKDLSYFIFTLVITVIVGFFMGYF